MTGIGVWAFPTFVATTFSTCVPYLETVQRGYHAGRCPAQYAARLGQQTALRG
jgi:hypothetical protein